MVYISKHLALANSQLLYMPRSNLYPCEHLQSRRAAACHGQISVLQMGHFISSSLFTKRCWNNLSCFPPSNLQKPVLNTGGETGPFTVQIGSQSRFFPLNPVILVEVKPSLLDSSPISKGHMHLYSYNIGVLARRDKYWSLYDRNYSKFIQRCYKIEKDLICRTQAPIEDFSP